MWNLTSSSLCAPFGLFGTQKRGFHGMGQLGNVHIAPNKGFTNPNFVNNHPTTFEKYDVKSVSGVANSCNILDAVKQRPELIEKSRPIEMCNKKLPGKNSKRRRRRKISEHKNKNSVNQIIASDMELDVELNTNDSTVDICISPKPLHLGDFIGDDMEVIEPLETGDNRENVAFSITPPSYCNKFRDRQVSLCESEDSFVVFESASDEECDFTASSCSDDEDDTSNDESESERDSELDSSSSVIPNKRVRFAEDSDLCEVHPMVQWAFAYQAARKGPWETFARDRERFKTRIRNTEQILKPIFDSQHRENIFESRFT